VIDVEPSDGLSTTQVAELPEQEREEVLPWATEFVHALTANSDLARTSEEILDRYLTQPVDQYTANKLGFALKHVAGDAGTFVLYYTSHGSPDEVMRLLVQVDASPIEKDRAEEVLRRLQALYGYQAELALGMMDRNPDDWNLLERKVLYDVGAKTWSIELLITKVNGEEVHLGMGPDTAVQLAAGVLRGVNAIDEVDAFDPDLLGELVEEMASLLSGIGVEVDFPDEQSGLDSSDRDLHLESKAVPEQ
jgi:hypothetical protein